MAGPAIIDLLFGEAAPSGKLPVTFPRVTGQIPIYYSHKNTGRPPTRETAIRMEDIERGAPQHSVGNTSFHLDTDYTPLFPFGYGLSYTEFRYANIRVSSREIVTGGTFTISADVTNIGDVAATEVVQLYIRDLVGSVTRPVKELRGFERCRLEPGETLTVSFEMHSSDLAFYGRNQRLAAEPGQFHAWIGGSSEADLRVEFELANR
jgi:beta-glucosidase